MHRRISAARLNPLSKSGPPPYFSEPMSDPEKQGMGCFAKGCLTVIVIFILVCGIAIGGFYYYAKRFVNELTSDKPVAIKVEQPTDTQMQAAAAKAQALGDAFRQGKEITVELTGPDINALI